VSPVSGRELDPARALEAARQGDRGALARLVSLVEAGGPPARRLAALTFPLAEGSYSVGVTGPPGAGKSTLTDGLIAKAREAGHQVGVLAVDPTSPVSGGALLGDRVRMQRHAEDEAVFIRSMASRGHRGGLAAAVPETIRLLAAAGMDLVLVETVGVGQVEVEVASTTDSTVVVVNPGWGDAVQVGKAGLLELADLFVVNKADRPGVEEAVRELSSMLDLSRPGGWRPPILATVASRGEGLEAVWEELEKHRTYLEEEGELARRRQDRLLAELRAALSDLIDARISSAFGGELVESVKAEMAAGRLDPGAAARRIADALAS
jgi:LAO/AO transport system kinase